MKSTYFQNYNIILFIIAVFISALVAHTCIPVLAIVLGFVLSMVISRFIMKKWWNETITIPTWQKYLASSIIALIGSQIGWVALLI